MSAITLGAIKQGFPCNGQFPISFFLTSFNFLHLEIITICYLFNKSLSSRNRFVPTMSSFVFFCDLSTTHISLTILSSSSTISTTISLITRTTMSLLLLSDTSMSSFPASTTSHVEWPHTKVQPPIQSIVREHTLW